MYQLFLKAFYWAESQSYPVRKLFHFTAGFLLSFAFGFLNPYLGIGAGAAAGIGKEIHDSSVGGSFSVVDVLITSSGVVAAYFLRVKL